MLASRPPRVQRRPRMTWLGVEAWIALLVMGLALVVAFLVARRKG